MRSIGNLYTGSASDYERPSLHAVGTDKGSQVYGLGLYAGRTAAASASRSSKDPKLKAKAMEWIDGGAKWQG